ncbi:siderophore-interacting protein [Actinomadura rupiterrae]|uniref:siderophore-interacting protein n=1 Tax=Actinomadura rupiterrae TaxID=559627 RepID=UPI0020A33339|nr:siderophore-interacting protein [Actinomadura rupiterrae]MCP2338717.1 NADPH-dependent ferric siderophore reductase [Actinomadura rupiterrae]
MFRFFDMPVLHATRLGPSMVRITLAAPDGFVSGGRDQRFKLFFPHPHQDRPVMPDVPDDDWFAAWRALDPSERAVMRTFTVRAQRPGEVDVDFALHGDLGPASRWASTAGPGDRLLALGPTAPDNGGVEFAPPPSARTILIAGDESALPAIGANLESLPPATTAHVYVQIAHDDDRQDLPRDVTWLVRNRDEPLTEAVRKAPPADYAWIAGEAGAVRTMRRHLVKDRGMPRESVEFMGYWRQGSTEETLLAETLAGATPHTPED